MIYRNSLNAVSRRWSTTMPLKKPPMEEDPLSKHGGKIALAAFAVAGGLIYTYYLGIQDRDKIEKDTEHESAIEPYEIQQLRHVNRLSLADYHQILLVFQQELKNKESIRYSNVIMLTKSVLKQPIRAGHFLDRMIIVKGSQLTSATPNTNLADIQLPSEYYMVMLNLLMGRDIQDRVQALHSLGQLLDGNDLTLPSDQASTQYDALVPINDNYDGYTESVPEIAISRGILCNAFFNSFITRVYSFCHANN